MPWFIRGSLNSDGVCFGLKVEGFRGQGCRAAAANADAFPVFKLINEPCLCRVLGGGSGVTVRVSTDSFLTCRA